MLEQSEKDRAVIKRLVEVARQCRVNKLGLRVELRLVVCAYLRLLICHSLHLFHLLLFNPFTCWWFLALADEDGPQASIFFDDDLSSGVIYACFSWGPIYRKLSLCDQTNQSFSFLNRREQYIKANEVVFGLSGCTFVSICVVFLGKGHELNFNKLLYRIYYVTELKFSPSNKVILCFCRKYRE